MHTTLFVIAAFLMGIIAAIPTGPVQIEVVRRAINGHLKPSLAVVAGAFLVDVLYGGVAFFGVAPFLEDEKILAFFWLAGGLLLTVFGVYIIYNTLKHRDIVYRDRHLKRKRWGFLSGVSMSATNPVMVLWWLSGARLLMDIGLLKRLTSETAMVFIAAGSFGIAAYLITLSLLVYWLKRLISTERLRQINLVFGVVLILIAVYFVGTSAVSLLGIS